MLSRFSSALLLGFFLFPSVMAFAGPPTVQLVVPDYAYPEATATNGTAIANNGTIVGGATFQGGVHGNFLRFADGQFSPIFNFPGATETYASGVNSSDLVCGSYYNNFDGPYHGFFYDGTAFTRYDVPGARDTLVLSLNDADDFCGYYTDVDGGDGIPFINIGGVLGTFDIPGAGGVYPTGINNLGQVLGIYYNQEHTETYGFFRDADGTLTYPLHHFGSIETVINGINDKGIMVGHYRNRYGAHAIVIRLPHPGRDAIYYDYPETNDTNFAGINNSLLISGTYTTPFVASFIAQLVR